MKRNDDFLCFIIHLTMDESTLLVSRTEASITILRQQHCRKSFFHMKKTSNYMQVIMIA